VGRQLIDPDEVVINLSDGEFRLLLAFVEHPRRVLTRDQLLDLSRGVNAEHFDRAIDVQISRLRRKLARDGDDDLIRTVRNEGYMFTADVDHELLRNLILSAGVRYARINPAGLSPKSREYEARLGARYLLPNRFMELRAGYAFEKRSAANPTIRFNSNNIFVTLTIKR